MAQARSPEMDTVRDRGVCPELMVIPAGRLQMGSPDDKPGRDPVTEGQTDEVTNGEPRAVGTCEVTREEFGPFLAQTHPPMPDECHSYGQTEVEERSGRSWETPGFRQGKRHPVICVNWNDAKAYVRWLT